LLARQAGFGAGGPVEGCWRACWFGGARRPGRPGSEPEGCRRRRPLRANELAELGCWRSLATRPALGYTGLLRETRVGWEEVGRVSRCICGGAAAPDEACVSDKALKRRL
jgi:hypothetical protein